MATDEKSFDAAGGCFFAFWLLSWIGGLCSGEIVVSPIVIILSVIIFIKWKIDDRREAQAKHEEARKRDAEAKRLEKERLKAIIDLKQRPLKTLSSDSLLLLAAELKDDEDSIEKFFMNAIRAGNNEAKELLAIQAEKCNHKSTHKEIIAHCDMVNDLVPNGMCYYRKGLALIELCKTDEAIAALEMAMSVDNTARSDALKLTSVARSDLTNTLSVLKKKKRKESIERDGQYGLVRTGIEYEDFVCGVIRRIGYVCKKTPVTDQGVDIVVSLKTGSRLAVQCKFLSIPVSNSAVQEVVAGKALYECQYACVVGKSGYTTAARDLARANNVWLITHDEIQDCFESIDKIDNHSQGEA